MNRFPDLPLVWVLAAALLAGALARYLPLATFPAGAGRVLILAGGALLLWAAFWFRRKKTTIEPYGRPKRLIVEGPYRINRNPIYAGMILVVAGWAIGLGAVSALVPAVLLPFVLDRRFVRGEEAALREAFGEEAERYFRTTRRW